MNYASLHASLGPTEPKPIVKKQTVSLTYNKNSIGKPAPSQTATAVNTPNTIMLRDANSSTNISTINVGSKLYVGNGATINGGAVINGLMKLNGTIDTSLGIGVVCSSSTGVLSSRQITSTDIANFTVKTEDIRDNAITTSKLAPNLFLAGNPTCDTSIVCGEMQVANVGYVNRFVTHYVNTRWRASDHANNDNNDSDSDEFDPCIFHVKIINYVIEFNFPIYIIENASVVINMPRKKKEGYCVKMHNKSGDTIFINSDSDRLMYNVSYSPIGTVSQAVENNRCVIFTYVYAGTTRSWSYQYF